MRVKGKQNVGSKKERGKTNYFRILEIALSIITTKVKT